MYVLRIQHNTKKWGIGEKIENLRVGDIYRTLLRRFQSVILRADAKTAAVKKSRLVIKALGSDQPSTFPSSPRVVSFNISCSRSAVKSISATSIAK